MAETNKHVFQSAKSDVGDATLVRPSNWNSEHRTGILMTNKSGAQQIAGVVGVLDAANNDSFTLTSQQGNKGIPVVVLETIANNAVGLVRCDGHLTVNVQGAVSRGNLLRFSGTSGSLENAGNTDRNPDHVVGMATTSFAGPGGGTVTAYMFGSNRQTAPTGAMMPFPQSSANVPFGWLLCDGSAVSRTTFADLFDRLGTTWGAGDGSTTFNLPDMRDRLPMGVSGTKAIGSSGGSETVTLITSNMPAHVHDMGSHTHTTPAHSHTVPGTSAPGGGPVVALTTNQSDSQPVNTDTSGSGTSGSTSPGNTSSTGSGSAVTILPQYRAVNYIIKW